MVSEYTVKKQIRRRRDSNPRCRYQHNSLAGSPIRPLSHLSSSCMTLIMSIRKKSGERGIRTPGSLRPCGFQDRLLRPLGHLSSQVHNYREQSMSCQVRYEFLWLFSEYNTSKSFRENSTLQWMPQVIPRPYLFPHFSLLSGN